MSEFDIDSNTLDLYLSQLSFQSDQEIGNLAKGLDRYLASLWEERPIPQEGVQPQDDPQPSAPLIWNSERGNAVFRDDAGIKNRFGTKQPDDLEEYDVLGKAPEGEPQELGFPTAGDTAEFEGRPPTITPEMIALHRQIQEGNDRFEAELALLRGVSYRQGIVRSP